MQSFHHREDASLALWALFINNGERTGRGLGVKKNPTSRQIKAREAIECLFI